MKKFAFILATCALAASCVSGIYQGYSFGNIEDGALMEDAGFLQSPTNPLALKGFDDGARVFYSYNFNQEDTVNVTLTGIQALTVKDVINVSEMQDTLGDRSVTPLTSDYSGGYLNIQFRYAYEEGCREIFNLVYDDVENQGETLVFSMYHKRLNKNLEEVGDNSFLLYEATGAICFPVNKIVEARKDGKKYLVYVLRYQDSYGEWHTSNLLPINPNAYVQKPLRNK